MADGDTRSVRENGTKWTVSEKIMERTGYVNVSGVAGKRVEHCSAYYTFPVSRL